MKRGVFQSKEFLKQRWEWYDKLKAEGFNDIEFHVRSTGEPMPMLNGMNTTDMMKMLTRWGGSKVEYYRLAEQQLRKLARKYGKKSWQYKAWKIHSEGHGIRAIAKLVTASYSDIIRLVKAQQAEIYKKQQKDDVEGYRD
jgi:hypothetical protein